MTFEDVDYDDAIFPPLKADLEAAGLVKVGKVGSATARLMPQRKVVDFAAAWFHARPSSGALALAGLCYFGWLSVRPSGRRR
ncbi:AAC(3) family N-acetyltransferase [Deinococcus peraridilitoris]|uniref:AAC(3) family N-acetyltransferase n=1 Tax=Deinococcus peraridilitoris TaxID=432329 RepID=UPI0003041B28|nr:AAC(3) family N-acetyltransferase [Deinococcus peraridilitoris]